MRTRLRKLGTRVRVALAIIIAGALAIIATAAPAQAHTVTWRNTPHVYSSRYGDVPMFWGDGPQSGVKVWIPDDTGFTPRCYYDGRSWLGDYTSNRWFEGTEHRWGYYGMVHSSHVHDQHKKPVGRC